MPNLPSFVELMDTLGIDNHATVPESQSPKSAHSRSSSNSSSASSPQLFAYSSPPRLAHKAQSIPSFRELEPDRRNGLNRHRVARYSPYAFGHSDIRRESSDIRRESLPYIAGHLFEPEGPLPPLSTSPKSPAFRSSSSGRRHIPPQLENIHSYSDDLPPSPWDNQADTPISSYVRRKTPQTSPISPVFPLCIGHEQTECPPISSALTMPFLLPTLPSIAANVTNTSSPSSDAESDLGSSTRSSPSFPSNSLPDIKEAELLPHRSRHTGLRLSAPHRMDIEHHGGRHIAPV